MGECDSAAAINGSKLSELERTTIKKNLEGIVRYIDDKLFK